MSGDILRRSMDDTLRSRAVIVGHLILTAPTIAATLVVPFLSLRTFGPGASLVYYVLATIALGCQWYSIILPRWKKWLLGTGVQIDDVERLARSAGLAWPVESPVGPFALNTSVAALCALRLGPWLLSRWYVWIMPLSGMSRHLPTGNDWLQHFELTSIVPALVAGYVGESQFFPMARRARSEFSMAGRLRPLQRQPFTVADSSGLYPSPA